MDEDLLFFLLFFFPRVVLDENSEPAKKTQRAREKASERNNWICFIGKFWFVFMCMCQANRRCLTQTQRE